MLRGFGDAKWDPCRPPTGALWPQRSLRVTSSLGSFPLSRPKSLRDYNPARIIVPAFV